MTEPAESRLSPPRVGQELLLCLGLLTCLPARTVCLSGGEWLGRACRWFPLVGALIGAVAAAVLYLATRLGLPAEAAAILALAGLILLTGGLHEDGLADVADGFAGGRTREDRLRIMRDSRIGTYGALALIVSVGLRWAALVGLLRAGPATAAVALIAAGAASRLAPVLLMRVLAPARADGLGATAGRPSDVTLGIAVALALVALMPLGAPVPVLLAGLAVALGVGVVAALARRCIGGQTGDVLGAGQQVTEIFVLLALAAAVP